MKMLRQLADAVIHSTSAPVLMASTVPRIVFRFEANQCGRCGSRLYVFKTEPARRIVTLHIGAFLAHETIMHCPNCKTGPLHSAELAQLVPIGCTFGYDVIVFAGRSLFLEHRTAEETVAALANANVTISESAVRELGARFVAYLGVAHLEAAPALSTLFALNPSADGLHPTS